MSKVAVDDSELQATQTAGYRGPGREVGEDERKKLEYHDESLAKWEASLGIDKAQASSGPKVTVLAVILTPADRPAGPIQLDLTKPFDSKKPVVMKEGSTFTPSLQFKVNHSLVAGMKYLQVTKRLGLSSKTEEMVGSYAAQADPITKRFPDEDVPSGMLARGDYVTRTRVVDDDGNVYLDYSWAMKIAKDW